MTTCFNFEQESSQGRKEIRCNDGAADKPMQMAAKVAIALADATFKALEGER